MRVLLIGSVVTFGAVLGLRHLLDDGPQRELCRVVSTSGDGRFQVEAWATANRNPFESLDPFDEHCDGPGWLVLRDAIAHEQLGEVEAPSLWSRGDGIEWTPRGVTLPVADGTANLEISTDIAPISDGTVPGLGWRCDEISWSTDGRFRLEIWSAERYNCSGAPATVVVVDEQTSHVVARTSTEEVFFDPSTWSVRWSAAEVTFNVTRRGETVAVSLPTRGSP